jgi:hypothetical protein
MTLAAALGHAMAHPENGSRLRLFRCRLVHRSLLLQRFPQFIPVEPKD